ncbi:MAG TPA: MFS transporter [Streptosporangiaceae bacterium]|jgi:EmrB/QacA subfamily drug resistance transporter
MTDNTAPIDGQASPTGSPRLGLALVLIVMAQLMVVLDATIVMTALPRIQRALTFSGSGLQWVVTGYAITFGGLLLLGGRAGDLFGRRRIFVSGLLVFSAASVAGGLAQSAGMLIAMRAVQGVGGAMIAPTALALITTTFPEGTQRNRAMGVYAAMSGSGAAIGLISGGLLTTYVSWRWVLFVNVPIGLITAALAPRVLPESPRNPGRFDLPGAITGTGGVAALVYGLSNAATDQHGVSHWGDVGVVISLVAAVVLLALFVVIERRSAQPLLPMRILAHSTRAGAYLTMLCLATAMFGIFFFMTLFLQNVLAYSPIQSGLAFLPFAATTIVMSEIVSRIVARLGPRTLMVAGGVITAGGTLWFSMVTEHSTYLSGLLGPVVVTATGFGLIFVPLTIAGTSGVSPADAGVAASLINTGQQVGGAIGLAALGTVVWTVVSNNLKVQAAATGQPPSAAMLNQALADGFGRGFLIAFGIAVLALAATATLIRPCWVRPDQPVPVGCPGTHWRRPRLARATS